MSLNNVTIFVPCLLFSIFILSKSLKTIQNYPKTIQNHSKSHKNTKPFKITQNHSNHSKPPKTTQNSLNGHKAVDKQTDRHTASVRDSFVTCVKKTILFWLFMNNFNFFVFFFMDCWSHVHCSWRQCASSDVSHIYDQCSCFEKFVTKTKWIVV
jgi:hypothetical protein